MNVDDIGCISGSWLKNDKRSLSCHLKDISVTIHKLMQNKIQNLLK